MPAIFTVTWYQKIQELSVTMHKAPHNPIQDYPSRCEDTVVSHWNIARKKPRRITRVLPPFHPVLGGVIYVSAI
jgi:hypothetical protein